ncbi:mitochondrial basic amino acids transporter-like [Zerene cesonia]|uniref:mitochondrial basic amino acids transporter-like n=1 Tax=Zerene cesonia TaxID=33412 RepID=UPI0018E4E738|nr:mitochondrial basic amino acids transporter-like [Zerene cesonia]
MALDFVAGCIGGCAGIIVGHPLDTLKVHIQAGRGSALECTKALLKGGSLSTAYRGVGAPLGGVAAINAVVFGAYGNTIRSLPNSESLIAHGIAGSISGLLQSLICAPIELIKTRQQLAKPGELMPTGAWSGARHILKTGGYRALFRGLGITVLRDSPAFTVYFVSYEAMTRRNQSVMRVFMAGGLAGALSWIVSYPVDVVKSRLQGDAIQKYAGAWDCFRQSIRTDGWRCMSRGLGPVLVRAFISNGACFTAVAWTDRIWQQLMNTQRSPLKKTNGLSEVKDAPEYISYDT